MARPKPDKTALLDAMADYVLAHGLNTASLRPLATAAGTSDRMLIYHFGSKDALVAELLSHLATRMAAGLDAALPETRFETLGALVAAIVGLLRTPAFRPYAGVWLDIVSSAEHGAPDHRDAGAAIIAGFTVWITARLPADTEDAEATAALALTIIEGVLVMDAVGQDAVSDRAVEAMGRLTPR